MFGLLVWALPASACMWDTDTLAMEAKRFPGFVAVVVGKFERNPPLYYEMRLKRVTAAIETQPSNFELYDDAAVACGRLGDDDTAIAWMARKHAAMGDNPPHEALYRYLANLGTFHAHRWIHHGADRSQPADIERAAELLREAIRINPDAHFGREKYQLQAVEWMRWVKRPSPPGGRLPMLLEDEEQHVPLGSPEAVRGLSGLVVLGAAWESVDVYYALARAVPEDTGNLQLLALLRAQELARTRHPSLVPAAPQGEELAAGLARSVYIQLIGPWDRYVRRQYPLMRAEADAWQAQRTAYMQTRLLAGRHPDTDPTFWREWRPLRTWHIDHPGPWWAVRWWQVLLALVAVRGLVRWRRRWRRRAVTLVRRAGEPT